MRGVGCVWVFSLGLVLSCGKSSRNGDEPAPEGEGGEAGGSGSSAGSGGTTGGSGTAGQSGATVQGGEAAQSGATQGGATQGGAAQGGEPTQGGGGEGGASEPVALCDDGNDCTLDTKIGTVCRYDSVADDTPCNDGSLCTLGDRCASGVCTAGPPRNGPALPLGRLDAYGTGLAFGAGNGRFAFVDAPALPARLTVADVTTGELRARAQIDLHQDVGYSFVGASWDDLLVVADGNTSATLNGPTRYFQLFTMEADGSLTAHTPAAITPGSQTIPVNTSLAGAGSSLFLCHNFAFFGSPSGTLMWWDVADPDAPTLVAQGSTKGQCGSVAVSDDGQRVYVNTVNGVLWSDLSTYTTGDLTFAAQPFLPTDAGLHLLGDRLLTRSGDKLQVFDESDHTELTSFSIDGAHSAGLTEAGIFVELDFPSPPGTLNALELRSTTGAMVDGVATLSFKYVNDIGSTRPIVSGAYGLERVSGVLHSLSPGRIQKMEAPELGAMSWAFPGTSDLHVRGVLTAHRVDLTTPAAPTVLAGGPSRAPTAGIQLDLSSGRPRLIPETQPAAFFLDGYDPAKVIVDPRFGHATATQVWVNHADEHEHSKRDDVVTLPGGSAELLAAGDAIYRAAYATTGGVRLQRFQIDDLRNDITSPSWELDFEAPAGTARSVTVHFDVDSVARRALLSTSWAEGTATVTKVYFVDVTNGTSREADTLSSPLLDLKLQADSWAYVRRTPTYTTELVFRREGEAAEQVYPEADGITRLLGFDGNTAYYAVRNALRAVSRNEEPPVLAFELATRGTPSALAEVPGALVVTTPGGLHTFAPGCE